MQSLSAILADIDFAHEHEIDRINAGSSGGTLKEQLRHTVDARHRERREPYIQQLGVLEARIRADMPDVSGGPLDRDAVST
jgi:hypothetical protein